MFGTLRLLLAFMVVISHLTGHEYFMHFGFYAVRGFFVLSGFLMTAALRDVYRFDPRRFWSNRALRLLPPYYLVCLLTLLAVLLAPASAGEFIRQWQPDLLRHDAITNLLVLPLHHPEPHFRLIPTSWSIALEVEMYVLLFFVIARGERFALAALAFGLLYHGICLYFDLGFDARYFFPPSAIFSFSLGALIYFGMKRGLLIASPTITAVALVTFFINAAAGGSVLPNSYVYGAGYYVSTGLFVIVVVGLANAEFGPAMRSIDEALGEIAYPVFLLQLLAAFVTAVLIMPGIWRGWSLMLATVPVLLLMAVGLAVLNRKLIDPLRTRIRSGSSGYRAVDAAGVPAAQPVRA